MHSLSTPVVIGTVLALLAGTGESTLVSLYNWKKRACTQASLYCPQINALPSCCSSGTRRFLGGTASGITGTQFHILFNSDRYGNCAKALIASNANNCIAATNAAGHGWCPACNGLKAREALYDTLGIPMVAPRDDEPIEDGMAGDDCVPATRMTLDGEHYFRVSELDMPDEDSEALLQWWDNEGAYEDLPEHLRQYEIEPEAQDREHIQAMMAMNGTAADDA